MITPESFSENKEKNVFIMMRYGKAKFYGRIEKAIKKTLAQYELTGFLARQKFAPLLWENIRACMQSARHGIVILEKTRLRQEINVNVCLEFGFMMGLGSNILVLKEKELKLLPTDIQGHSYMTFCRQTLERDIRDVMTQWLRETRVIPAVETIDGPTPEEAKLIRTRRIIAAIQCARNKEQIRQVGSLSSFAIAKEAALDSSTPELRTALLEEQKEMINALGRQVVVKCIICPDIQRIAMDLSIIPSARIQSDVLPRLKFLIGFLRSNMHNKHLQMVHVSRLPHDNMLIIGNKVFIGRRRVHERGFPSTTIVDDPKFLEAEIEQFDLLFKDAAQIALGRSNLSEKDLGSRGLKHRVISHLEQCEADLKNRVTSKLRAVKTSNPATATPPSSQITAQAPSTRKARAAHA